MRARSSACSSSPRARGEAPIAVRAFTPDGRGARLRARRARCVETNTEDLPFLVDSVSAELRARGLGIQRVLHPIVGVERDADGAIAAVLHPREATRRESVMHFDLDRRLAPDELAGAGRGAARRARRRAPRGAGLPGDGRPRAPDGAARRRGRRALRRRRGRRDGRLPRVAAARQLHLPRLPRVPLRATGAIAVVPGSGPRDPGRRRTSSTYARAGRRSSRCRPTCASARSRATC